MRSRHFIGAAWLALAGAGLAGPALADTKAGVEAWERGDYRIAVEEWRRIAATGEADAQFNLGQAYKLGRGVPVDPRQAESWYAKAAAQGHEQAEDNLGLALFQNGRARDAIPWLEKSVARGEPRAQYILGTMLFNGVDIKKDWVRAYALTSRSAQAGLPQATQSLQQMDAYLSPGDRRQGLAMAAALDGRGAAGLPGEVAGRGGAGGMRAVDLPPSLTAITPRGLPPEPAVRDTARPSTVTRSAPPPPVTPRASGGWRLQLGAFGEPGNARKLGTSVAGRFPGRSISYARAGALTKVLVGPFASRSEAQGACGAIKPCVPVAP